MFLLCIDGEFFCNRLSTYVLSSTLQNVQRNSNAEMIFIKQILCTFFLETSQKCLIHLFNLTSYEGLLIIAVYSIIHTIKPQFKYLKYVFESFFHHRKRCEYSHARFFTSKNVLNAHYRWRHHEMPRSSVPVGYTPVGAVQPSS